MRIEEFRARLQPHLDSFIAGKTRHLTTYSEDTFLLSLLDYPGQLASGRGKRIRPYVTYLLFRSLREDKAGDEPDARDEAALRLLVSLELFHLFCVVHDGIIDRGTQRYGLPTIQRFTAGTMQSRERCRQCRHARRHECGCVEPERIGDAQAMLCGDLLFAWAHEVFNSGQGFTASALDEARPYFSRMIDEWQSERARHLYEEADAGVPLLERHGRFPVRVAGALYGAILDKLAQQDYNVFAGCAKTSLREKIALTARVLREPKMQDRKQQARASR